MPKFSPKLSTKLARQLTSIRVLLIAGTSLLLIMVAVMAAIGIFSLLQLQNTVQTTIKEANRVSTLSSEINNEFLLARQEEANLLTQWRSTGYDEVADSYVLANANHLEIANELLDEMAQLVQSSSNTTLNSLQTKNDVLRPLLQDYSNAFQATALAIQQHSGPEGLQNRLNTELQQTIILLATLPDSRPYTLLLQVRANEQSFYATDRQEYADNLRLKMDDLLNILELTSPQELGLSTENASRAARHARLYLSLFQQIVLLEQNIEINSTVFYEVTGDINQITSQMGAIAEQGHTQADIQLQNTSQQTTYALGLAASLTIGIGILIVIFLARRIVIPLNQLTQVAEQIGQGDFSQRATVAGGLEIITLARTFNAMVDQLRQALSNLEQRVAERTSQLEQRSRQLQVAAEIARDATSTRDLETLLKRAVDLVRERFGFYHAGLFLIDEKREYAVLHAATGSAGRTMLERGHRLKIGDMGMVANVAQTGLPRITLDVGTDSAHLSNPLLPETRSEMTLPLKVGEVVIGILDVQSEKVEAFKPDDITILQTMADQLAIAIDDARLYNQAQATIQRLEVLYGRFTQQTWEKVMLSSETTGYEYGVSSSGPIYSNSVDSSTPATIRVPLKIRDQVIADLEVWSGSTADNPTHILPFLEAVSDRIGQAMESARAFEETQAQAAREQLLNELVARFSRSLEPGALLQLAAQELGRFPHVAEVSIHVGPGETFTQETK